MTDVISAEEVALRRAFRNYPHFTIEREESFSITYRDKGSDIHIVTIYPRNKFAEFCSAFEDPTGHGPALDSLLEYLRHEGYKTNLK